MAYSRKGTGAMTQALGQFVGLLLSLYVFDEVIDAIFPTVNDSTWFQTAIDLITPLFGVVGILAAFEIIYRALGRAGLV